MKKCSPKAPSAAATTDTAVPAATSCCTKMKSCCKHAGRAREIAMASMTAMAMFGPRRFRPYFQHILAVISVVTATVQFFRRRKDA